MLRVCVIFALTGRPDRFTLTVIMSPENIDSGSLTCAKRKSHRRVSQFYEFGETKEWINIESQFSTLSFAR